MLISEFARATKMSVDTVRFYVSKGLLHPEVTLKGGSRPYQIFSQKHVDEASVIRLAQSLGFSIKEIAALGNEYRTAKVSSKRSIEIMQKQVSKLEEKASHLTAMIAYFKAKIAWQKSGRIGLEPTLPQ